MTTGGTVLTPVDFGRRFEMAHTAKQQLHCAKHELGNAAVHLEALLRNADPMDQAQTADGVQVN